MPIARAAYKSFYAIEDVERRLQALPGEGQDALRHTYPRMLEVGGQRLAIRPAALPDRDFPPKRARRGARIGFVQ